MNVRERQQHNIRRTRRAYCEAGRAVIALTMGCWPTTLICIDAAEATHYVFRGTLQMYASLLEVAPIFLARINAGGEVAAATGSGGGTADHAPSTVANTTVGNGRFRYREDFNSAITAQATRDIRRHWAVVDDTAKQLIATGTIDPQRVAQRLDVSPVAA